MPSKIIFTLMIEQSLVLVILLMHLKGFMNVYHHPVRRNTSNAEIENQIEYSPHFTNERLTEKVVFIIIDALREDHLVTEGRNYMPYSKHLIETKQGIGYRMKTASPTVTLPRIKSIITGAIPSFMDVIFNFASKELVDENIIHSAHQKGMKINFYGDETWLKLFPRTFHRWEGVTSFFVSDYTEVDNNVTRHLPDLFSKNNDWDILILHYLGLDHIGHLEGPKSPHIGPKLKEMDNVIKKIHQDLTNEGKPYLLLVCGDHGMSDVRGHGGDSHSEIWTSALIVSHLTTPTQKTRSYTSPVENIRNQIDIASTLALHLGLNIPLKNIGIPFYEELEKLSLKQQLSAHYRVTKQLAYTAYELLDETEILYINNMYADALAYHNALWKNENNAELKLEKKLNATTAVKFYKEFQSIISPLLSENMQFYDLPLLLTASLVLIMISLPTIIWTLFLSTETYAPICEWIILVVIIFGGCASYIMTAAGIPSFTPSTFIMIVLCLYGVSNLLSFVKCFTTKFELRLSMSSVLEVAIVGGVIMHPFCLLATSLVEEEHFGYYFSVSVVYFLMLGILLRKRLLLETCVDGGLIFDDKELIEKDLIISSETPSSPLHPMNCYPVMFDVDSRLLRSLSGRMSWYKGSLLHTTPPAVAYRRLYYSRFLLLFLCWTLFRLLREFNATGDKWKNLIRLNDILRESDETALIFYVLVSVAIVVFLFRSYAPGFVLLAAIATVGKFFPVLEKGVRSGTLEAQFAYLSLFSLFFYCIVRLIWFKQCQPNTEYDPLSQKSVVLYFLRISESFFAQLFILLQRPENVLVSSLCFLHFHTIIPILVKNEQFFRLPRTFVYVIAYWIAQSHFFIQGNSNSLTTVNISSGFVGMASYVPFIHGTLIAIHTFGAKFLVLLHTVIVVLCHDSNLSRVGECLRCWWMLQLLNLTVYVINVTLQRHHLFIWSVFAPKLLYEESHFICLISLTVLLFISFKVGRWMSR